MTDVLTGDELDAMFDSGEDMGDMFEWDEAFHDDIGNGNIDVAVRVYMPRAMLDAAQRMAERRGQTRSEFVVEAVGAAIAAS